MAMEDQPYLPEASNGTGCVKGKKKPVSRKKKESENRAKKKPEATSVNEEQAAGRSDGPGIKVLEFDHCVENHFKAIDTMAELCGDREDGVGEIDERDIQRFSSSTIFLREWRYYNYEPKTVKFASDSRGPEDKDADISVNLPQFSSAAFLKNGAPPEAATSLDFRNFVMYVGGPIWALDWCPQDHERTDSLIKCEYIAVSAHPPCSSYHKMGIPLTGRGMVQIWCVVHGTESHEAEPTKNSVASSNLSSQPRKPRGRPPGRKKNEASNLPSQPKRPRGRPKKKQESNDNSVERSTLQEVPTCNSDDEVLAQKKRMRRKVETKNHVDDVGTLALTENRENESNAINLQANENVISEYSGEDTLLCNNVSENAGLDPSSIFSIPESVALPRVVLCLAHNGKVAWDLKWKPTNACDAKCKHRMGYLALLLGNGSLEVWEVPFPHVMRAIYSKCNGEGTDPRFVKLKPTFRCSMLRSANKQSIPLTVEWSSTPPYDYLLAGCHDGTVALWKFSANSPCEDTRPLLRFSADTVPIRGVAWAPNDSDPECENVILTAGHGGLKFWDLRDPFRPLWDLHPAPRIIYSLDWLSDPRCTILSFDDGTLRLLSLPKAACDVPVTGKPFTRVKQKGLHTYCCTSTAIWSVQVSRQTGMVAYCGADGTVVRFQLTTKAVVKENSRNRTPQFVCDYFTEEQSTITIHTPELDVPFPLKKMSNRPDPPPLSMRAILSEIQSNEGNHKTAAASLSENGTLAPCFDDDFNVESGSEDTPTSINKKSKTQSKCKKKGEKDNQESECSDEANDVPTNNGGAPGSGDSPENLPPKSVAVHRVRWNMNTGSERWLCYGGAAGLLRCQEILLSALDKKLMMKK
ncbi:uncharacterized protein LOC111498749 [Cucurbita maxima]|uniref:Uncharacterized protein LOC111498749 n=1 Tax=Cucurbita maxima TaxID=3661 RepID=A0A6J1KYL7_CUCMA|nr:uncharacterized protein LOC111498749 [Cucurbita maxima]